MFNSHHCTSPTGKNSHQHSSAPSTTALAPGFVGDMASNFPRRCCYTGVVHEGAAKGRLEQVGGNRQTSVAILVLTDVLGHKFRNLQLIADQFAANGYFVVMPDLFEGDPVPLRSMGDHDAMKEWFTKGGPSGGHTTVQVDPIVEGVIQGMRVQYKVQAIGAVGYCFGAKYVARFSAAGKGINVGAFAHPSFVDWEELKAMTAPLSIAAAETDPIFPVDKRRETEDILKNMEIPYQITLYSGVDHGFAVRADLSKREVRFAKEAAFFQHVQWFDEFLPLRNREADQ